MSPPHARRNQRRGTAGAMNPVTGRAVHHPPRLRTAMCQAKRRQITTALQIGVRRLRAPVTPASLALAGRSAAPYPPVRLQLTQAARQERPLGRVRGQRERPAIGRGSLRRAVEPAQQVGPGRVEIRVVVQQPAGRDPIDDREADGRPVGHRDRHGPIELDDRRRAHLAEHLVQRRDLRPVRVARPWPRRRGAPRSPPGAGTARPAASASSDRAAPDPRRSGPGPSASGPGPRGAPARRPGPPASPGGRRGTA